MDCALALEHWERILTGLEHDPLTVADSVDWIAKHRLISAMPNATNSNQVRPLSVRSICSITT